MTKQTATNTPPRVTISLLAILSLSNMNAMTQTKRGVRLHIMPTIDTLKNFKLMKEIKTERAPCRQRNTRLGMLCRSTASISVLFRFQFMITNIMALAITPRMKVTCAIETAGFSAKSCLAV